jgi:type I restriction enzyme R subunit
VKSEKRAVQAVNNTKEQFNNSPDIDKELEGAIIDALSAHTAMSKQALESAALRADLKAVLLGAGKLWEGLRHRAGGHGAPAHG